METYEYVAEILADGHLSVRQTLRYAAWLA
jgi:hypothetical protein